MVEFCHRATAEWEAPRSNIQQARSDFCHGVDVGGESDALEELSTAHLGSLGASKSEEDVSVLLSILKDGILFVGVELPAGGGDDLAVTFEGFVGGNEV